MTEVNVSMGDPLRSTFAALEAHRIRWALMRMPPAAPELGAGDIDVLVHPEDVGLAESAFAECGFLRLPRAGMHFLRYDSAADRWLWFHVVCHLAFGTDKAIETGQAVSCLDRRSPGQPPTLAPEDEFWILLLHCACDKRRVAVHHQRRLQALAAAAPVAGPLSEFMERLCAAHGADVTVRTVIALVERGDWTSLVSTMLALERTWTRMHSRGPFDTVRARVRRALRAVQPAWRGGLSVALLGPDGAGKSTLARGIANSFELPVRTMYMGLTGGALKYPPRLRLPGLVFAADALVIWQRYARSRLHRSRGRVVVFDRYLLDAEVPHPRRLSRTARLSRRLHRHLCPSPDLVLVLDAPGHVMHERKGEYSPDVLEDWRRHFLALRERVACVEIIDATQSKDAVRIEATDLIWRHYCARSRR